MVRVFKKYNYHFNYFSKNIKLFMLGSFFLSVGGNIIWLLFNLYLKSLKFNETIIGNILALRSVAAIIIAIPASLIVLKDRIKPILIYSSILNSIFFFMLGLFTNIYIISTASFMVGLFSTTYQVATSPFIMRNTTPEERSYVFGLNAALANFSGIIGSIIGGISRDFISVIVKSDVIGYKIAIIFGAFFSVFSIFSFSKIIPKNPTEEETREFSILTHIKNIDYIKFAKLILPGFIIGLGAGMTIPFINLYFKNVWKLNDSTIGVFFAMGQLCTFLGMLLSPLIATKIGKVKTIVLTQAFSIPFILVLAYLKFLPIVVFAYLIRQTLMNMNTPVSDHFTMEYVKENEQPVINALKMLAWTGSWAISASVGGYIIENYSFTTSFLFTTTCYTIATLLFYIFFGKEKIKK
ncbi:MAG: MFS transporter [Spirochaetes bacterium]|nr:MFS transporter [Spirochaetota bacterium]